MKNNKIKGSDKVFVTLDKTFEKPVYTLEEAQRRQKAKQARQDI